MKLKRIIPTLIIIFSMFYLTDIKGKANTVIKNPTIENGITTWSCVYFGNYWQYDTNGDGVTDKTDTKEPIKWRVLSVNGKDAFLLADKNLDVQRYNDSFAKVTWETSTIRSWLNGYNAEKNTSKVDYSENNFINYAFSSSEQAAIKETMIENPDNPGFAIEGGNNTSDKVYLLSFREALSAAYGFSPIVDGEKARMAINTAYVINGGEIQSPLLRKNWWLRTPGNSNFSAIYIGQNTEEGHIYQNGIDVNFTTLAVRPVLHLDLAATSHWSYAGTINSNGIVSFLTEEDKKIDDIIQTKTESNQVPANKSVLRKGSKFTKGNLRYKITKLSKNKGTITVIGVKSKKIKKVTIPRVVNRDGVTLKVTAIGKSAFKNCKKLKKVTIRSKNIKKIGKKAFAKIPKKTRFIVPKSKIKKYSKMIKKAKL